MGDKLFLSYGRGDDEPFVRRLYDDLTARGFDVWFDRVSMPSRGLTFLQEIRDEIDRSDRVLLIAGPYALASAYVRAEWEHAQTFAKAIMPLLRLGEYFALPADLQTHAPDFRATRPYDEAFAELLDKLRQPVPPVGTLSSVPVLPLEFVARPEASRRLLQTVLGDTVSPIVISGAQQTVAIVGMGGLGKSVLAAAFARSAACRRAFGDGILWLNVGTQHDLLSAARELLTALAVPPVERSWSQIRPALSNVLRERSCLIILDDIWHTGHVNELQACLGGRCRLLITTRDARLAEELGAVTLPLDLMSEASALSLLAAWARLSIDALPALAQKIVEECGRLPLAVALCGALVRRMPWAVVLAGLRKADRSVLSRVFQAMQSSVAALAPDQARLYETLAVFPSDRSIPVAAIVLFWSAQGIDGEVAIWTLLGELQDKALLQINQQDGDARVTLHDLQFDYLRDATRLRGPELHGQLVEAYRAAAGGDWLRGQDDGYFFQNLCYHLAQAGRADELCALLTNFAWLFRKLTATNIVELLRDFDLPPSADRLPELRRALHQSAPAVSRDPNQLAGQITGRLDTPSLTQYAGLVRQARHWRGAPWLRPVLPSLLPPNSALSLILTGHEGTVRSVAVSPDSRVLASASNSNNDQTVRLWDLASGVEMHTLPGQAEASSWTPMAFAPDGWTLVTAFGAELRVWNWRQGTLERTVRQHADTIVAMQAAAQAPRLVSADNAGHWFVWDTNAWQTVANGTTTAAPVLRVALSPDGATIACATESVVEITNHAVQHSWQLPANFTNYDAWRQRPALQFSHDNRALYWGNPLQRFDLAAGISIPVADVPQLDYEIDTHSGLALAFPPSDVDFCSLHELNPWRLRGELRISVNDDPYARRPSCVALSPGGSLAILSDFDHRIEVWDAARIQPVIADEVQRAIGYWITDDGLHLLVKPDLGQHRVLLRISDGSAVDDSTLLQSVRSEIDLREKIRKGWQRRSAHWALQERLLDANRPGALITKDRRSKGAEFEEPLAQASEDRAWPLRYRTTENETGVTLSGHLLPVLTGILFPGLAQAATAGIGRVIRVWDLASGRCLQSLRGHTDSIHDLAISEDERWLASCGADRTARVWDLRTGTPIAVHTSDRPLYRIVMSRDGRTVVTSKAPSGRIHLLRLELPG